MTNIQKTHSEGVELVRAELTRRAIAHERTRKRASDLGLLDSAGQVTFAVKVKMKGPKSKVWQDHIEQQPTTIPARESVFYIFVDRAEKGTGQPRFWIVPFSWMRQNVYETHKSWIGQIGGVRPKNPRSSHHSIEQSRIDQWRDRWDQLTLR